MTKKEEETIHLRLYEIQNQIRFLKENRFNDVCEIADYIVKLETEYNEKLQAITDEIAKIKEGLNHEQN